VVSGQTLSQRLGQVRSSAPAAIKGLIDEINACPRLPELEAAYHTEGAATRMREQIRAAIRARIAALGAPPAESVAAEPVPVAPEASAGRATAPAVSAAAAVGLTYCMKCGVSAGLLCGALAGPHRPVPVHPERLEQAAERIAGSATGVTLAPGPHGRCECLSSAWEAWFWLPSDQTPGQSSLVSRWSEKVTHEQRMCLVCGGSKGDPKRLVDKRVVRGEKPAPAVEPDTAVPVLGAPPLAGNVAEQPAAHAAGAPPSQSMAAAVALPSAYTVPLSMLVLDPALQCRAGVVEEVVAEYAEAWHGTAFPPIRVIRADEQLLVVDGWHRVHAARRAKATMIAAEVVDGTRRDALLEAVRANRQHGLQRTTVDKRRAVVVLLRDAEWCQLASRKLAEIAGVTHTHVDNMRKRYGVAPGELLGEDRVAEVDGELPERYETIAKGSPYIREFVGKVREARNLRALASAGPNTDYDPWRSVIRLRLEDLAVQDWPWPSDTTEKQYADRAATVDAVDDIAKVILARQPSTDRFDLFKVWQEARAIGRASSKWALESTERALKGRPALLNAVKARLSELKQKEAVQRSANSWTRAEDVVNAGGAVLREGIRVAEGNYLVALTRYAGRIEPTLRGDLKERARTTRQLVECPAPGCVGWATKDDVCWKCREYPSQRSKSLDAAIRDAGGLVAAGRVIVVGDTRVDLSAVRVLAELAESGRVSGALLAPWIAEAPEALRVALEDFLQARLAETADHVPDVPEEEDDDDEDLDDASDEEEAG
jgi:hypothetical protein